MHNAANNLFFPAQPDGRCISVLTSAFGITVQKSPYLPNLAAKVLLFFDMCKKNSFFYNFYKKHTRMLAYSKYFL